MDARKREAARALERRGQLEAAAKAYAEAGAIEDAVRLLAKGGLVARAGKLLLGAGQHEQALQLFVQHRLHREAADVATRLGRDRQAGELLAQAGLAYEAAESFVAAGDAGKALEQLQRVPRDDPRYRSACVRAVAVARDLGAPSFELELMLDKFLETGPQGDEELEVFYELGLLYLEHGHAYEAKQALEKVLAADPGYRDAAAQLSYLEADSLAPALGDVALPDLPEAPELPDPAQLRKASHPTPAVDGPIFVVGATIAGRYRLEDRIGTGGMAVVFKATDLELGEAIALKVFTQVVQDEAAEERFRRELRLSRQLSNPHIVRLFDIGSFRGIRYISMELLKGCDLRARMASPLAFGDALGYLAQACEGLHAAHEAGVIHRDFKPENCFVTLPGLLKVMDFGIAKVQNAPGITTTGIIVGTPAYIAPEQVSNFSEVSFASDLYALGVVAYELFAGRLPFSHPEPMKLLMMHINDVPVSPRTHNPAIPEDLERVILKLLEKDPRRRFPSGKELARVFEEIGGRWRG